MHQKPRFDRAEPFASRYDTPGWQRAQARAGGRNGNAGRFVKTPVTIDAKAVRRSTEPVNFTLGERVFHLKFGNGNVVAVDGNKLTIRLDKAGEKRVVDSFVERA